MEEGNSAFFLLALTLAGKFIYPAAAASLHMIRINFFRIPMQTKSSSFSGTLQFSGPDWDCWDIQPRTLNNSILRFLSVRQPLLDYADHILWASLAKPLLIIYIKWYICIILEQVVGRTRLSPAEGGRGGQISMSLRSFWSTQLILAKGTVRPWLKNKTKKSSQKKTRMPSRW